MKEMLGLVAFLGIFLGLWKIADIKAETERDRIEAEKEIIVYEDNEFRAMFVDTDPEQWIDDEEYGEYAKELLKKSGKYVVIATVYNATIKQCGDDPSHTADGSKIDSTKLEKGDLKWIAVSRDLLTSFSYGDKVRVDGTDFDGLYEVHDTMHSRYTSCIDLLMPASITHGRWENVIIRKED